MGWLIKKGLEFAGDLIATVVIETCGVMVEVLRSIITAIMILIFNLFETEKSAGFGMGDNTLNLSESGLKVFFNLFGENGGLIVDIVHYVVFPVAVALSCVLIAWGLYKSIISDRAKEGVGKCVMRALFAVFFVAYMYKMLGMAMGAAQGVEEMVYERIAGPAGNISADTLDAIGDLFGEVVDILKGEYSPIYAVVMSFLSLIFPINLTYRYIKVVMSYFFRFIRLELLHVFSPLAGAAYATESTEDIFKAYIRLYVSSLISVIVTYALVLLAKVACVTTMNSGNMAELFVMFVMTRGLFEFIDNIDGYLNKFKLSNVPNHSLSMMDSLAMEFSKVAGRAATTKIPNAIGAKVMDAAGHYRYGENNEPGVPGIVVPDGGNGPSGSGADGGGSDGNSGNGVNGNSGNNGNHGPMTREQFSDAIKAEASKLQNSQRVSIKAWNLNRTKEATVNMTANGKWEVDTGIKENGGRPVVYRCNTYQEAVNHLLQKGYTQDVVVESRSGSRTSIGSVDRVFGKAKREKSEISLRKEMRSSVNKLSKMSGTIITQHPDNPDKWVWSTFRLNGDGTVRVESFSPDRKESVVQEFKDMDEATEKTQATVVYFNETNRTVDLNNGVKDTDRKEQRKWERMGFVRDDIYH